MLRSRRLLVPILALLLPANMLWVFVACADRCAHAVELSSRERACVSQRCCDDGVAEIHDGHDAACKIVAIARAVLSSDSPRPKPVAASVPHLFAPAAALDAVAAIEPANPAHAPPLARPLDRLPVLLI